MSGEECINPTINQGFSIASFNFVEEFSFSRAFAICCSLQKNSNELVFLIFRQNKTPANSGCVASCDRPKSRRYLPAFFTNTKPALVGRETFEKNELGVSASDITYGHSCALESR
jgi:hypothetical protein